MKPRMTLKKIASELGVSISTVSKALHNNKEISQENRDKIQAFAKLYNYRPNSIALNLKNNKSKTIGLIIPEIVHFFFAKVISGIEKVANSRGYNLLISVSSESMEKEIINMDLMVDGGIDGFIISLSKETLFHQEYHHFRESISQGIPIVMFDRVAEGLECDKVIIDDKKAAKTAVEHLLKTGCKNILLLTTRDYINIGKLRTEGYLEVLRKNDIPIREELIVKVDDRGGMNDYQVFLDEEIRRKLDAFPEIDGVFAVNEIYAITVLNVARMRGLRIPDDLSVISFSDGILSRHSRPSLTTIKQNGIQMGEMAARILLDSLDSKEDQTQFSTYLIDTELVERDTTKVIV
ncbi:LacI family transcriptional regulator [Flagellimonas sp. HMM57]|uniref:LacI family DNA-binding transcriptional regulator n=1 Tax=unclassified Flagellimonas TaxID=2644544 RepID=UPI0013D4B3A9|nr:MULTISPECIES: LacI family DNA-binding transcriptional regulator [unclassified Flagellimonas]UII76741.1 LacI family transcriptional regulator [Flagellimonas sp. HMM57]